MHHDRLESGIISFLFCCSFSPLSLSLFAHPTIRGFETLLKKCACTFHTEPNKEKQAETAPAKGELGGGRMRLNPSKWEAGRGQWGLPSGPKDLASSSPASVWLEFSLCILWAGPNWPGDTWCFAQFPLQALLKGKQQWSKHHMHLSRCQQTDW